MTAPGTPAQPAAEDIQQMTDADFAAFGKIIYSRTGIVLNQSKRWMLNSRLLREVRRLGLKDFASYRQALERSNSGVLYDALTSAVTTNVTSFFRGPDHFVALAEFVPALKQQVAQGRRVRIWSAGCSTGEEPYSIAMTLLEHWPDAVRADIRILATDIDPKVVEQARRGVFDASRAEAEPSPMLKRFLTAGPAKGQLTVAPALQSLIRFEELNLLGDWPFRGNFDIIFCRNVVIYFDADTRNRLWRRFSDRLEPGGWLFVGHSERVDPSLQTWLRPAGITRYQRTDAPRALGADLPDQSTAPSAKTLT